MKLLRTSLRNKLVSVFLLPTLITVLLYGFLAYFAARQGLEDELGKRLVSVGQTLSADLSGLEANQIGRLDPTKKRVLNRLRDKLVEVKDRTGVRRVFLFDRDLNALVDTRPETEFGQRLYEVAADRLEVTRTFDARQPTTSILFEDADGTPYKTGYAPVVADGEVVAAIGVEGSTEYFALLRNFATVLLVLGALALVVVVVAGTLFARALVRPVNRLVAAAERLGKGELEQPVIEAPADAEQGDEIAFLAQSFEEMRQNILSRDRQMQMMLSGIAHEVRNPLGGMELFCGLLREDITADGDPDAAAKLDKLERIERELGYLEKVVKDFLDFARRQPVERERFSADDFARDITGLLAGEVDDHGCALELAVGEGVELTADRQKLRRAVINLVRNAYQACEGGGHIRLTIAAGADAERVVTVADDGPGIPAERLAEALTPFYTTKEKGSGLGLALTQQICEQHGGRMAVDSAPGKGTTVRLYLPFDPDVAPVEPDIPEGWLG